MQDTALDTSQDETLYILNAKGRDALAPRLGTWARWSADGRTVYCDCAATLAADDCVWQAIDVISGASTPLLMPSGARPSVSPHGLLAFDDGEDTPSLYVFDPRKPANRPRLLTRAAIAPIWLTPNRLAFTNTHPCPRTEDDCIAGGHGSMFEPAGTAAAFDLTTNRRTPLTPIPTEGADTSPRSR